ncbi:MAG: B12-binding domain-containing radical SAM protein [bacterium]
MKSRADIILYFPRSANSKYRVPMSLLALGSMLENRYDYAILDGNFFHDPIAQLSSALERTGAQILGMSVMPGPQLQEAIPLVRHLRRRFPGLQIIWGGYFPSNHTDIVLQSGWVDYVMRGPVEREFAQLSQYLNGNGVLRESILGLSYRENGRVVHNPQRMPLAPIDDLPPWPYERLGDMRRYLGKTCLGKRTMAMHTSYGCPFKCSFCAVVPIYEGGWVARTAPRVADDVESVIKRFGVDAIEFDDNNFFTSVKRTSEFAEELLQRELRVSWWGEARPDTLENYPDGVLAQMRRAGCKMIFLGAESGSALRLEQMNKGGTQTPETILRLAEKLRRHDIVPEFSFVLGAPADDVDSALNEEIAFIRLVKKINPQSEIIIYVYAPVPVPGSSLFEEVQKTGFQFPARLEDWQLPQWSQLDLRRNPLTPWLKPRHFDKIHHFEAVLNARYPTNSDVKLTARQRRLLQVSGAWRYATGFYFAPYEIKLLQRWMHYRQPEIEGF